MKHIYYQGKEITIYEFQEAEKQIARLSDIYYGDKTVVASGGRNRNRIEYYNYACAFDIETTTIKPGELDYSGTEEDPPIAFPYLFQFNIYGSVIMVRHYSEAMQVFSWLAEYFRTGANRRLVIFDHNLGYEYHFFRDLWKLDPEKCFALDEHHPVTLITKNGLMFRDSYKMANMSLETLTKDWSKVYFKEKELMNYSKLRTPYTELDNNTLLYSALDVLSLSDAIQQFLIARHEFIWTKCPTSTSFIRKGLKKEIGIGVKRRTEEQKAYFKILQNQRVSFPIFEMLLRQARGGNTHANRKYTGLLLKDLCHFDITSSYPVQMVCYPEYPLGCWAPLDLGTRMDVIKDFEAGGYCCLFDVILLDPDLKPGIAVPYISISKMTIVEGSGMRYTDNGRYIGGLKAIRLTLFGVEWPIIESQYDFSDAVIVSGYFAKKGYLPDIIRKYVLQLYAQKTTLKGVAGKEIEYAISKTYVNGVFGMTYTNPLRDTFEVTENDICLKPPEDPAEFLEKYQSSISYFMVYAWGCMVATLGRVYLQKMIDACYIYDTAGNIIGSDFVYCDTDSIFALHPEIVGPKIKALEKKICQYQRSCGLQLIYEDIKGRPHELGSIDEEPRCEYFKTYGAKKYITVEAGKLTCTIAGVPKKAGSRLIGSPERFQLGFNFKGKDTGKNCLWYNPDPGFTLHDEKGRPIEIHSNVAMLPCDYLLSLSNDYMECLSVEGNFHWNFKDADTNTINEEDY